MSEEKLLTVREVAVMLGVTEKAVLDLAENSALPAYKVGGVYLRFKREQIEEFRKKNRKDLQRQQKYSWKDRIIDFCSFNDFYVFSAVIIMLMLYIIFR
jgi:excisionase family DNA binding protein